MGFYTEDLLNNGQKTVNHEMLAVGERVKAITKEAEKALKAAKNTLDQLYTIPKQVQELLFSAKNEGLVHFHDWRQAALYIHQVQKAQDCPP
ncbi:hypothetical protein HK103_007305 [Boothiomyces macroporosus]|uniref:Uncharacterized protein n=1 Tax=Boothiomyces macroporosus TaxID=261099 RepID=A0AAD5UC52_9FUNG|nr:hypothetical protein HK103_007305 [Boothiomyces macroporosus]